MPTLFVPEVAIVSAHLRDKRVEGFCWLCFGERGIAVETFKLLLNLQRRAARTGLAFAFTESSIPKQDGRVAGPTEEGVIVALAHGICRMG